MLLQLPETLSIRHTTWTAEEGLCALLYRLAYWSHLLRNFTQSPNLTQERLELYCTTVHALCPLDNCFGFIDGTLRAICRPSVAQRGFYNGQKRHHGVKYQTIVSPDGLIVHTFGPMEGRRHDAAMLRESGVLPQLQALPDRLDGLKYAVYGDAAYPLKPVLCAPYGGNHLTAEQTEFNRQMKTVRECVEWGYAKVLQYFAFVDFKKNQKILLQPLSNYYYAAVLLTNRPFAPYVIY